MTATMMACILFLRGLAGAEPAVAPPAGPGLESRLRPLIAAHQGKVALAVKNLKTGESFGHHESDPMPTARLIDCGGVPVALCVLTRDNDDRRYHPDNAGNRLCAAVARAVYDQFHPEPAGPAPARAQ